MNDEIPIHIDSCGTIDGPKRAVLEVLRLKRNDRHLNYALKLECGHVVGRNLLRDADEVRCPPCKKKGTPCP